jgi:tRNA threonylcarbamoyladenosine biosynthesis protein TsaB
MTSAAEIAVSEIAAPRLLLIETSGRVGQVAVAAGERLLAARRLDQARRHARDLAPAVRDLLRQAGWRPPELTAVLVGRGPGSYTGLRVGIMSAKAMAYAVKCPILAVDTFPTIALAAGPAASVDVIADAQQGRVYAQRFAAAGGGGPPAALTDLVVEAVEDWLARLPAASLVTGPGLVLHAGRLPPEQPVAPAELWEPRLDALLALGLDRLRRGEADNLWKLEPLYLRPSSAEELWARRTGQGPTSSGH